MEMSINITGLHRVIDSETDSILFYRQDFIGIPDHVLAGDGFTVELRGDEVVMIDIYNAELLLTRLAKEVGEMYSSSTNL
jgi:hypothetical protein